MTRTEGAHAGHGCRSRRRIALVLLLALALVVGGAACGGGDRDAEEASPPTTAASSEPAAAAESTSEVATAAAAAGEEAATYGVVTAVQHPYYNRTEEAMAPTCEELGCETIFAQPPTCDAQAEIQVIRDVVTRGIDGLAVAACDATGVESAVQEVVDAGIPVVTFDADCCQALRPIAISNSDAELGRLHAETVNQLLPNGGKIIVTVGALAAQNVRDRLDAFKENVSPNIEILQVYADEHTPEQAQQIVRDAVTQYPEIDLILDQAGTVSAVGEELKNQGYAPGEIQVVGINDFEDILALVREGYITGTVMLNSGLQGELALRSLDYIREGKTPSEDFFGTGGVIVTADNVDTYLEEVEELNSQLRAEFESLWN